MDRTGGKARTKAAEYKARSRARAKERAMEVTLDTKTIHVKGEPVEVEIPAGYNIIQGGYVGRDDLVYVPDLGGFTAVNSWMAKGNGLRFNAREFLLLIRPSKGK